VVVVKLAEDHVLDIAEIEVLDRVSSPL